MITDSQLNLQVYVTTSAEETQEVARNIARSIDRGCIIALTGDLGAGKTTFSKGLISELCVYEPQHIQSPTFIYLNTYPSNRGLVCHFDLYRLGDACAFEDLGFCDYLDGDHICLIEWPEIIESLLPKQTIRVNLSYISESQRRIEIERMI